MAGWPFALKGRDIPAQGEALGCGTDPVSPERARHQKPPRAWPSRCQKSFGARYVTPLQGSGVGALYPGLRPGLICAAPSGLELLDRNVTNTRHPRIRDDAYR